MKFNFVKAISDFQTIQHTSLFFESLSTHLEEVWRKKNWSERTFSARYKLFSNCYDFFYTTSMQIFGSTQHQFSLVQKEGIFFSAGERFVDPVSACRTPKSKTTHTHSKYPTIRQTKLPTSQFQQNQNNMTKPKNTKLSTTTPKIQIQQFGPKSNDSVQILHLPISTDQLYVKKSLSK